MRASYLSGLVVSSLTCLLAAGCNMDQRFITPEGGGTFALAIAADTPAFFTSMDLTLFLVETRVELPVREPTAEELAALEVPDGRTHPWARRPWVERGDYEIQIDWTLSSLSDAPQIVTLTVNGFNEFDEYMPGVSVVDDDFVIDFANWERTLLVQPGARIGGTIREEELDEIAVDLATVVNGAPNPNQVVFFQNHSDHDERSRMFIPGVVPALTGFRIGLRVGGEDLGGAPPMALEFVVRVRDPRDRIVGADEESWMLPVPTPFVPALAVAAMMPAP